MSGLDAKATKYLTEGRVKVQIVTPDTALVHVTGSQPGDPYFVKFSKMGGWKCDCPARVEECAHVKACMQITNLVKGESVSLGFNKDADIDSILGL